VRLAYPRARDLYEFGLGPDFLDRGATEVSHARANAAHELLNERDEAAFVRHASFDAFGNELFGVELVGFLEIAVGRALLHRPERAHAAIRLVRASLVKLGLAGRFFRAREEAADHHGVRAGGERLGDVARIADAAIGDQRHVGVRERFRDVRDGGDLRHADARDDPRRADRAGTDADLHRVGTAVYERLRRCGRRDIAADHLRFRVLAA
jgi:hypothetical protein